MSARRACRIALVGLVLAVPLSCQVDDFDRAELAPDQEPPAVPLSGQGFTAALPEPERTEYERFALFARCGAVSLSVFVYGDEAEDMGLTEERVRTMAESRLRAAGLLYDEDRPVESWPMIVAIQVVGPVVDISLDLWKSVQDLASGESGMAGTWGRHRPRHTRRGCGLHHANGVRVLGLVRPGVPAGERGLLLSGAADAGWYRDAPRSWRRPF